MQDDIDIRIPEQIASFMTDTEMENMRSLDGWAVGTVYRVEDTVSKMPVEIFEDAWIELFNGAGQARELGGVRFMAVNDGEYEEAYAYPSSGAACGNEPCYYVTSWTAPEDPDVGKVYPNGPGVSR